MIRISQTCKSKHKILLHDLLSLNMAISLLRNGISKSLPKGRWRTHRTCFDRRTLSEFKSQRLRNEKLLTFPACLVDCSIPLQLKIFLTFWHLSNPQRLFQLQTNETISISSPKVFHRMGVPACYQHPVCTCGK